MRDGFDVSQGDGAILAVAVHAGHDLRPEVAAQMTLDEATRLREEDPYTDRLTTVAENRVVPHRSRFEVDLNRPRDEAVYRGPDDAWGLEIWKEAPSEDLLRGSLEYYDRFYRLLDGTVDRLVARYGRLVVLDVHSYNHRRRGPDAPPEDAEANPDVNVGTGSVDRDRFGRLVERFETDLASFEVDGRRLDVRENVRFRGREVAHHIHATYPGVAVALAIEFKKTFMDEWTGELDRGALDGLRRALGSTIPGLIEELQRLG